MRVELVVTEPFKHAGNRYQRGSVISDPTLIAQAEKLFPRHYVRRVAKVLPLPPKAAPAVPQAEPLPQAKA